MMWHTHSHLFSRKQVAAQTAAGSCRLEKLGDAFLHPLRDRKLWASPFRRRCEKVAKKKEGHLPRASSLFQARWSAQKMQVHELHEKPVHLQRLHIAACRQAAPIVEFAHGCGAHFQRLASHRLYLQGTQTSGLCWHAFGHFHKFAPEHIRVPVHLAISWTAFVESALRRNPPLAVLYQEEVGCMTCKIQALVDNKRQRLPLH